MSSNYLQEDYMNSTTLHLSKNTIRVLNELARIKALSRTKVITFLIHRLMQQCKKYQFMPTRVRYQKRNPHAEWKKFHVKLLEKEYSFLVEMRCVYRYSASYLISEAIEEYLTNQNLINTNLFLRHLRDNNIYYGHAILGKKINSSICWRIFWNLPNNPKKIFF